MCLHWEFFITKHFNWREIYFHEIQGMMYKLIIGIKEWQNNTQEIPETFEQGYMLI